MNEIWWAGSCSAEFYIQSSGYSELPVCLQVKSPCNTEAPTPVLQHLYLYLYTAVSSLQTPAVVFNFCAAKRHTLSAVEHHSLSRLNGDITACVGDGRMLLTWRQSEGELKSDGF